jgi:hypothetical protein
MFISNPDRFEFVFPKLSTQDEKVSDAPDPRPFRLLNSQKPLLKFLVLSFWPRVRRERL